MNCDKGDGMIQVELAGGPAEISRLMDISRSTLRDGKIKIPFAAGYEHFVFQCYTRREGRSIPILTWSTRTRIAE